MILICWVRVEREKAWSDTAWPSLTGLAEREGVSRADETVRD